MYTVFVPYAHYLGKILKEGWKKNRRQQQEGDNTYVGIGHDRTGRYIFFVCVG